VRKTLITLNPVHKIIMARASPLLWKIFHSTNHLELSNISREKMLTLISFIYKVSISSTFYATILHVHFAPIFWCQNLQSWNITRESWPKHFCMENVLVKCRWNWLKGRKRVFGAKISYEKCARKTLMKLTTVYRIYRSLSLRPILYHATLKTIWLFLHLLWLVLISDHSIWLVKILFSRVEWNI